MHGVLVVARKSRVQQGADLARRHQQMHIGLSKPDSPWWKARTKELAQLDAAQRVDLTVTDRNMPAMDGITFTNMCAAGLRVWFRF
jgi:CheY-like chemotaxis protein